MYARKVAIQLPDTEKLEKARELRVQEIKMYDIFREVLFYCIFLWLLLMVSYNFRDPNSQLLKQSLKNTVTDQGLEHIHTFYDDFGQVCKYYYYTSNAYVR